MNKPDYHVFVCSSSRVNGSQQGYCIKNGGREVIQKLFMGLQEEGMGDRVMVTNTGCFGVCSEGPVMVIYPEGTWYGNLEADDVDRIIEEHLKGGEVIAELEI